MKKVSIKILCTLTFLLALNVSLEGRPTFTFRTYPEHNAVKDNIIYMNSTQIEIIINIQDDKYVQLDYEKNIIVKINGNQKIYYMHRLSLSNGMSDKIKIKLGDVVEITVFNIKGEKGTIKLTTLEKDNVCNANEIKKDINYDTRIKQEESVNNKLYLKQNNLEQYINLYGHEGLTDTEIANFYIPMMKQSVYKTLDPNSCPVKEITPYNYDEIIYGDTKPKLVLWSRDKDYEGVPLVSRGLASIFRALSQEYKDKVDFYFIDYTRYVNHETNVAFDKKFKQIQIREDIKAPPSTVIYNKKQKIDILKGGLSLGKYWKEWFNFIKDKWIPTNISNKNGEYVWRFNNSSNERKIFLNE